MALICWTKKSRHVKKEKLHAQVEAISTSNTPLYIEIHSKPIPFGLASISSMLLYYPLTPHECSSINSNKRPPSLISNHCSVGYCHCYTHGINAIHPIYPIINSNFDLFGLTLVSICAHTLSTTNVGYCRHFAQNLYL